LKVSCEGIPFVSSKNFLSQSFFASPNIAIVSQSSHPDMTAHNTMLSMSESACSLFSVSLLGSATLSKYGFGFGNMGSSCFINAHVIAVTIPAVVAQSAHSASAKSPKASRLARRRWQPVQPSMASQAANARFSTMHCLLHMEGQDYMLYPL